MKILTILAILLLIYYNAPSQTLVIERNDVEQNRSHFITATYPFSIDIIAKDVFKCTGVTFELYYNNAEFIKFSNWTVLGFGKNPNSLVIPIVNNSQGIIHIGVLSNDLLENPIFDEPRVIRLEFVVSQSAPHNLISRFSFRNAKAVVNTDTVGKIINLESEFYEYIIRGFVDVWPGDADNNGKVTTDDVATIGYLLGLGTRTKSMKSFKRTSGSTLWAPQKVLAWDSASATFADCDGNGDITIRDVLVVSVNFGKTQFKSQQNIHNEKIQNKNYTILDERTFESKNSKSTPIYVSIPDGVFGVYAKISLNNILGNVLGLQRGNLFNKEESYFIFDINTDNMIAEIVFGSINGVKIHSRGIYKLCDIVYEPYNSDILNDIDIKELTAVTEFGFQPVNQNITTTKKDNDNDYDEFIVFQNDKIIIKNPYAIKKSDLKIFNIYGSEINDYYFDEITKTLDIASLPTGAYILTIQNNSKFFNFRILKY